MLLGCLFAIAFTSELRTELIESTRFAVWIDVLRTNLHDVTHSMRSDACQPREALTKAKLVEPSPELTECLVDR